MISKPDWDYLRPAIIIMLIALILSAGIKLLGFTYYQSISEQYQLKNEEYSNLAARLDWLNQRQDLVDRFKTSFVKLKKTGLFEDTPRVDWVDSVNTARAKMKLPVVRYQILPQSPYFADYLQEAEYVNVMSNEVVLEAELLHEGDLADLFEWMERAAPGQLYLSECELTRIESVFNYYAVDRPNMKARCDFTWFTIIPKEKVVTDG